MCIEAHNMHNCMFRCILLAQSVDVNVKQQILTITQNVLNFLCSVAEQAHEDLCVFTTLQTGN